MDLKLITKTGEVPIEDVVEFTAGKRYFFARRENGDTLSILRSHILRAFRQTQEGNYKKIYFRQFKNKR